MPEAPALLMAEPVMAEAVAEDRQLPGLSHQIGVWKTRI